MSGRLRSVMMTGPCFAARLMRLGSQLKSLLVNVAGGTGASWR